jgi:hypothetical protein
MNSFEYVMALIRDEREYQDLKWGALSIKEQSVAGYLLILEFELIEAKRGWEKNLKGRDSALSEIKQIAAVAVACLQQHSDPGKLIDGKVHHVNEDLNTVTSMEDENQILKDHINKIAEAQSLNDWQLMGIYIREASEYVERLKPKIKSI